MMLGMPSKALMFLPYLNLQHNLSMSESDVFCRQAFSRLKSLRFLGTFIRPSFLLQESL